MKQHKVGNRFSPVPPSVADWAKDRVVFSAPADAYSLVVCNRSTATFYAQVFDQPGSDTTQSRDGSGVPRYDVAIPPNGTMTLTNERFYAGMYVRPVTAAGGVTIISGTDCKITCNGYYRNKQNCE